jgi:outer membrane protein assembly factor BamB
MDFKWFAFGMAYAIGCQSAKSVRAVLDAARLSSRLGLLLGALCLSGCEGASRTPPPQGAAGPDLTVAAPGELVELPPLRVAAGDWPWWRGVGRDNLAPAPDLLTHWNEKEGILWRSPIPGQGHATPVLVGDLVILATADEASQEQSVIALDRRTGECRWQTAVHRGGLVAKNATNTHASATPACDGERLFVSFLNRDALHVTALDLAGTILWQTAVGPFTSEHGGGPSPVLYRSLVLVDGDNPRTGFLAAVHRQTGKIVWRRARPAAVGNYATPTVADVAGKAQLLISGAGVVEGCDPLTGRALWTCQGPQITANTVVAGRDLIFACGGNPRRLWAIRTDGHGDVTDSHVAWRSDRESDIPVCSTMLLSRGFLYIVTDSGIALCCEETTGDVRWRHRLGGTFWSSPLLAGNNLYATNQDGETYVFEANSEKFVLIATNKLAEGGSASPIAANGLLYLRTTHFLYCIGEANVR